MGHAVFKHPAVARAVGDHLIQCGGVDAFTQTQRHRLGRSGDVHASQQLVDDFDLAAGPGTVAKPVDLGRHGVQQRAHGGVRCRHTCGHHRHLATGGFGGTTRDRRVKVENAQRCQPRLQCDRPIRINGGTHDKDTARRHGRCTAALAKQHSLGLGSVHHHRHDHLALPG